MSGIDRLITVLMVVILIINLSWLFWLGHFLIELDKELNKQAKRTDKLRDDIYNLKKRVIAIDRKISRMIDDGYPIGLEAEEVK